MSVAVVLQRNGLISSTVATLSYAQCTQGQYLSGYSCKSCDAGVQLCSPVVYASALFLSGSFTNVPAQSQCLPCDSGSYLALPGKTVCLPCDAGRFRLTAVFPPSLLTQDLALHCSVRNQSLPTGPTDCTGATLHTLLSASSFLRADCPPGSFAAAAGQSSCTPCEFLCRISTLIRRTQANAASLRRVAKRLRARAAIRASCSRILAIRLA